MGLRAVVHDRDTETFSNPTFTGNITGAPKVLAQNAIPFIFLSSGSVAANGAISAITALPVAYASAYCYFPANILATTIAAGWHYCTFSTTTAGTAYLNTYSGTGAPTIPGSPTAVTDGKGAFTGVVAEVTGPVFTLDAGSMGANGSVTGLHYWGMTNNANAKTLRMKLGGGAGTAFYAASGASGLSMAALTKIANRGSQSSQVGSSSVLQPGLGLSGAALIYGAVDTSVASSIAFTSSRATATDNIILELAEVQVLYGA